MCDCGISWSYLLTLVAFGQALHQANRLENLVQLFKADSHTIGIKLVHGIDDAIAKLVFDKCVKKMDMYISLILLKCKPNIYVSWSTSESRVRLVPLNRFRPSSKSTFYLPFQGGASFFGSFLFVMLRVGVLFNVMSALWSLEVTCWERTDRLAVVCVVFCHFSQCVLVHIRIKGGVGAVKLV